MLRRRELSPPVESPAASTSISDVDLALADVDTFVRGGTGYADFIRHRNRYRHDAQSVQSLYRGGSLLEIGGAPFYLTAVLAQLGLPVTSVDLAPARGAAIIERYGLQVVSGDIEREPLPFADGSQQCVVFNEVLEHLRVDPLFTLSQINRVLADDGVLMLTTPNLYAAQQIARYLTGRGLGDPLAEFMKLRTLGHMGHIREYSHAEVLRLLDYSGFAVVSAAFNHYHYPKGKRGTLARLVFTVLPKRFRTFQVVVARKRGPGPRLAPLA
jgi:SAM-dependent methyltransferase